MTNFPEKVYINGDIIPHQEAKISVFDRGFIFGDGIYEVMLQLDGNFFYVKEHLNRLAQCLEKIQITFDINSLLPEIRYLLEATGLSQKDCLLYIQVTRGVAPRKHCFPKAIQPTVIMYATPFVLPKINSKPIKSVTLDDYRWSRCDIKMTSLLGNIMANEYAAQNEAYEAILIRDGVVTEASHCNVFFVKNNVVYTHPANEFILNGITRKIVLQLCKELDIATKELAVKASEIPHMEEAFLTGTSTQIASIQQIDGHKFYEGKTAGSITSKLQEAFLELKNNHYEN